ncbi:hypothetical protein SAMN04489867_0426 [Pedococcus dokdonensis]|uniref:Uncharacterized protein n=1 Tax=Pedococcus dokdonensis TaxID=443156 RepID=A0A1H0LX40_9MICO|nr:hypothetical protein [Pedococcus dokdonensis]SDO72758.1 hypothetical protein SAMN04489867_0426 [Pedococcus dokdonensis]
MVKITTRPQLTAEQAAALRREMPDDPVRDAQRLACECCGRGVVVTELTPVRIAERLGMGGSYVSPITVPGHAPKSRPKPPPNAVRVAICPTCAARRAEAKAYVEQHPALEQRYGNVVRQHVETALQALDVIGLPRPTNETHWAAIWPRLWRAAGGIAWSNPETVSPGYVNRRPWDHVRAAQRDEMRKAYADGLRALVARHQPSVPLPCPGPRGTATGCLYCGVSSVTLAAADVARLGGVQQAQDAAWRRVLTNQTALGRTGPEKVRGHLCATCSAALDKAGGAVGVTSRTQALADHLVATGRAKLAGSLRDWLQGHEGAVYVLPAHAVTGRPPSSTPWVHAAALLDAVQAPPEVALPTS